MTITWRDRIAELISPYDDAWLPEALGHIHDRRPESLFKYQTFSDRRLQCLAEGKVHLSAVDDFYDPYDTRYLNAQFNAVLSDAGICCFSERRDSLAMWSSYSGQHTGFCAEYDTSSLDDTLLEHLFPVVYLDDHWDYVTHFASVSPPSINLYYHVFALNLVCCKSSDWSYEQEWRCVLFSPYSRFF